MPVRFKPGTGDNTDNTPTRLAPPTLRPIELTARCQWCLYVLERPCVIAKSHGQAVIEATVIDKIKHTLLSILSK